MSGIRADPGRLGEAGICARHQMSKPPLNGLPHIPTACALRAGPARSRRASSAVPAAPSMVGKVAIQGRQSPHPRARSSALEASLKGHVQLSPMLEFPMPSTCLLQELSTWLNLGLNFKP